MSGSSGFVGSNKRINSSKMSVLVITPTTFLFSSESITTNPFIFCTRRIFTTTKIVSHRVTVSMVGLLIMDVTNLLRSFSTNSPSLCHRGDSAASRNRSQSLAPQGYPLGRPQVDGVSDVSRVSNLLAPGLHCFVSLCMDAL